MSVITDVMELIGENEASRSLHLKTLPHESDLGSVPRLLLWCCWAEPLWPRVCHSRWRRWEPFLHLPAGTCWFWSAVEDLCERHTGVNLLELQLPAADGKDKRPPPDMSSLFASSAGTGGRQRQTVLAACCCCGPASSQPGDGRCIS